MRRVLVVLLALAAPACGSSPALSAAQGGDFGRLRQEIAARESQGNLSNDEAAAIAHAVAERALREAHGDAAIARIHEARSCAHELDGVLADRMQSHDAAGGEAALARVDGQGLGFDDVRGWAQDPDATWRAVGVRGLVQQDDGDARRRALLDPSPLVRRYAARAARYAQDPADLDALSEAARVDPEPIVRNEAVRAMAELPPTQDGRIAKRLSDLWTVGDDGVREDIAIAWASPNVWDAGGRAALGVLLAADHGTGVVEVAAVVLRRHDAPADLAGEALAQMARAIDGGSRQTRLQAIAETTLDRPVLVEAVRRAGESDDLDVATGALGRLAANGDASAIQRLERFGQPGSPVASRARFALAGAGDRRVQKWLQDDLAAPDPEDRLSAATGLSALGFAMRAAPLLADGDASVRVRAACTIMMAARVVR
jgi:HEAT repeat protein